MRGYAAIGLHNPKNPINVGHVLRAAGCYNAAMVAIAGIRPQRYMRAKIPTDTQKAYRHLPVMRGEHIQDLIPYDCVPVAVDLIEGATPLQNFVHPERAFYIFGAEDATLGEQVVSMCKHTIYVPTTQCMNLSATVNVILYDRLLKQGANNANEA